VLTRVWWVFLCVTSSDIYRVGVLRPEVGPMAIVGLAHGLVTKEGTSWHLLVLVYLDQMAWGGSVELKLLPLGKAPAAK